MADRTDDILLRLRFTTAGVEEIARVQTQILALEQRSIAMQQQQAAAAGHQAAAMGQLAGSFGNVERATTSLERSYTGLGGALVKIPGFYQLISSAANVATTAMQAAQGVIQAGADTEKWQAAFEVLKGGPDAAREHIAKLVEFAAHTPFELPQVVQASKLLESLNLETDKYLGTLGNVAAFLDRPLTDAVLAVGNAQRGEFENLKTFGVDISVIMQRAGVSLNSSARRTTEENHRIVDELIKYWDEKFGGGMERISQTTDGRLSNLSDAFFQFKAKIAASGVGDVFRQDLQRILDKVDELEKDGTLERWAKGVSDAMTTAFNAAEATAKTLVAIAPGVALFIKSAAAGAAVLGVAALAQGLGVLLALTPQLVAFLSLWKSYGLVASLDAATVGMTNLRAAAVGAVSPLGAAAIAVGGITLAVNLLADALAEPFKVHLEFDASREQVLAEIARLKNERDELAGKKAAVVEGLRAGVSAVPLVPPVVANLVGGAIFGKAERASDQATEDANRALNRAIGKAVPPLQATADKGKAGPGAPDPEKAAKAFQDAVKRAQEYVQLELQTGKALAAAAADSVERRLGIEAQGAAERLALLDRIQHDAFEKQAAFAEAQLKAEQDIEDRRQTAIAAAVGSGAQGKVLDAVKKAAEDKAALERKALAQSVQDGTFLLAFDRELGEKRVALEKKVAEDVAQVEAKAAQDRQELHVEVLRFQLATTKAGTAEWKRLLDELNKATGGVADEQQRLNIELAKFLTLGIDAARARELIAKGIKPEDVAAVGNTTGTRGAEAADLTEAAQANALLDETLSRNADVVEQMRATWAVFFHDVGAGWELAAEAALVATSGMAAAGTAAYNTLVAATTKWFKHHQGTHALALQVVKSAAREGAAATIEALASIMKTEGAKEAAAAIAAVAKAIEFPPLAGQYLAAAGKHALAAAAYGVGAAVATGAASAIRSEGAQEEAGAGALAGDSSGGSRQASSTRLRTVAGNAPITQNFNVSIGFFGGLNLFGPEAAVALAREMRPVLQQMLNDRELVVPTPSGG